MSKLGLNLLKMQVEPPTVWDKLYAWITSTARIIIMLVEVVVIIAFAIRLVIDFQGKAYDSQIDQAEKSLKLFQDAEFRYRQTQTRTNLLKNSWILSPVFSDIVQEISKYIPQSASEINMQIDKNQITIAGTAPNGEVGALETALKNSDKLINTEVKQIQSSSNNPNETAQFVITTNIKNIKSRVIIGTDNSTNSQNGN